MTSDGARKARLYETRNVWSAAGLNISVVRGENTQSFDRVELVDAAADDPAELLAQEDLVLDVEPALVAIVLPRRQRQVEVVAAVVAAVADHVARAERDDVAELDVVRLVLEDELDRVAVDVERQQVVGLAVEDVGEEVQLQRARGCS